jgi:hypothetical protein
MSVLPRRWISSMPCCKRSETSSASHFAISRCARCIHTPRTRRGSPEDGAPRNRFWEMHDRPLGGPERTGDQSLVRCARELDLEAAAHELAEQTQAVRVEEHRQSGIARGVAQTRWRTAQAFRASGGRARQALSAVASRHCVCRIMDAARRRGRSTRTARHFIEVRQGLVEVALPVAWHLAGGTRCRLLERMVLGRR